MHVQPAPVNISGTFMTQNPLLLIIFLDSFSLNQSIKNSQLELKNRLIEYFVKRSSFNCVVTVLIRVLKN